MVQIVRIEERVQRKIRKLFNAMSDKAYEFPTEFDVDPSSRLLLEIKRRLQTVTTLKQIKMEIINIENEIATGKIILSDKYLQLARSFFNELRQYVGIDNPTNEIKEGRIISFRK